MFSGLQEEIARLTYIRNAGVRSASSRWPWTVAHRSISVDAHHDWYRAVGEYVRVLNPVGRRADRIFSSNQHLLVRLGGHLWEEEGSMARRLLLYCPGKSTA